MTQAPIPDSLLTFPCDFPIKIMGSSHADFEPSIVALVQGHDATFTTDRLERRASRAGAYTGLTVTVRMESREQLDALYRALTSHPMVKVVL